MAAIATAVPVRKDAVSPFFTVRLMTIVCLANMAILVLQVAAVRQLAPLVGNSLDTWTGIIGMFLAGITLGNWYGGKLADRYPRESTLRVLLWLSALGTLSTLGLSWFFQLVAFDFLPLYARIALISFCICFPTSFVLSLITPLAIRLALPDVRRTGRIVGLIYALGTLGSLVGNYLTGFVLLAYLDLNKIVLGTAAAQVVLSFLALGRAQRRTAPTEELLAAPEAKGVASAAAAGDAHLFERSSKVSARSPSPPPAAAALRDAALADAGPLGEFERVFTLPGNTALACVIVFVASFCSMALELTAPRLLAPEIGISLYSFTAIVGVCLGGIALGNFFGGIVADTEARQLGLSITLLVGGLLSLGVIMVFRAMPDIVKQVSESELVQSLMQRSTKEIEMILRVCIWAAVFFPPLFVLGMVSPQVIRLVVRDVEYAGRIAGRVYAFSCLGALLGIFATGWWLISLMGVYRVLFLAGVVVAGLACIVGQLWKRPIMLPVFALAIGGGVYYILWNNLLKSPFDLETNYYAITIGDSTDNGRAVKTLSLDHLIHSYVDVEDPTYMGYEHEQVQAEFTYLIAENNPNPHVLVIGGGGYTYPRWVEHALPRVSVEVVEIDPGVTEINHSMLGLRRDTKIKTHNMDGRQFIAFRAPRGHYDLVVQDAVNDLSVPFHLMTKEYNDAVKAILKEDGIYLLTVIDLFERGELMRAAIRTLTQSFDHVHLLDTSRSWDDDSRSVFVIYASQRKLDLAQLEKVLVRHEREMQTKKLEQHRLQEYIEKQPQIILTDQYAPVDNLISILYRER